MWLKGCKSGVWGLYNPAFDDECVLKRRKKTLIQLIFPVMGNDSNSLLETKKWRLYFSMGSLIKALCVVSWKESGGWALVEEMVEREREKGPSYIKLRWDLHTAHAALWASTDDREPASAPIWACNHSDLLTKWIVSGPASLGRHFYNRKTEKLAGKVGDELGSCRMRECWRFRLAWVDFSFLNL